MTIQELKDLHERDIKYAKDRAQEVITELLSNAKFWLPVSRTCT